MKTQAKPVSVVTSGAMRVEIREYRDGRGGSIRYGFDWKSGNQRRKVRFLTVEGARGEASKLIGQGKGGRIDLLKIPPEQFAEFMAWQARQKPSVLVKTAVTDFLARKEAAQANRELSEKHVSDLRGTLDKFAAEFGKLPLAEACDLRKDVEAWLQGRETGPRRFNNMLSHLVSFIHDARSHKYVSSEPTALESIPRRKTTTTKATYSPAEMAALLRTVPMEWLPAIIIGGFCGVRPEELCPEKLSHKPPLQWEDFRWEKATLRVSDATAKDARVRWVPICETAGLWLTPWRDAKGPCVPRKKMSNKTSLWAQRAGIAWKPDALRHSYASYRLAITHNIGQVSEELGNSVQMIRRHYLDPKYAGDAAEYFALTPEKVGRMDITGHQSPVSGGL